MSKSVTKSPTYFPFLYNLYLTTFFNQNINISLNIISNPLLNLSILFSNFDENEFDRNRSFPETLLKLKLHKSDCQNYGASINIGEEIFTLSRRIHRRS